MAEQVPSAGEWERRGSKVISKCFDIHAESASEIAVLRNPIPGLKKDPPKNPIPGLKKSCFDFYTRPTDLFLNSCLDRSSQEKNFPNTAAGYWRNTTGIHVEISASVTTNHLFLPLHPGKAAFLLPISQPNCDFLWRKCNGRAEGGGGGQPDASHRIPLTDKIAQKIYSKWRLPHQT
jgi:hypothetical protein